MEDAETQEPGDITNEEEEERLVAQQLLSLGISKDQEADRFTPLASQSRFVPPEEEERPTTPEFPSFLNTPTSFPSEFIPSPAIPLGLIPPTHQTATLPPPAISPSLAFPAAVFPKPPILQSPDTPTLPPAPAVQSYFPPNPPLLAPIPITPIPPISSLPVVETLDPSVIAKIQKHAKWAISALNYDDLVTARKELKAALQLLG